MYVEDVTGNGTRWLKYSVIFSNEDGGTPAAALMARWGRTTDIELAYEVELRDGRVVQGRYQGPDHRVIPKARLEVRPPLLLVSTLNNMFLDRGHPAAVVRLVPEVVQLDRRTRESVMDDHPWIYRVMARELASERPEWVADPRDYVYVDMKLEKPWRRDRGRFARGGWHDAMVRSRSRRADRFPSGRTSGRRSNCVRGRCCSTPGSLRPTRGRVGLGRGAGLRSRDEEGVPPRTGIRARHQPDSANSTEHRRRNVARNSDRAG